MVALGATAIGCAAEAQIGGQVDFPSPDLPPADQDGDGIVDADDKCPTVKEDGKPPSPNDGCPNLDEDGDGIPVPQDKCPKEPETVNGHEDDDGCPDKKPLVQIVGQEVKINQKIIFKKDSAKIEPESNELLEAVAKIVKEHPELQLIEVGGHASKEGDDQYNRKLTQKRVESVVSALSERGVEKERLIPQGYGFHCPLAEGTTADALEQNRRVEFKILYRDNKNTDVQRGCGASEKAGIKLAPVAQILGGRAAAKAANDASKGAGKAGAGGGAAGGKAGAGTTGSAGGTTTGGTGTGKAGSGAPNSGGSGDAAGAGGMKRPTATAPKPPPSPAP
jgi:outer membrane protein OmpA-like peptidoglycan-associated protein